MDEEEAEEQEKQEEEQDEQGPPLSQHFSLCTLTCIPCNTQPPKACAQRPKVAS